MAAPAALDAQGLPSPTWYSQPLASDFLPEVRPLPAAQPLKDFLIFYIHLTHQGAATPKGQEKKLVQYLFIKLLNLLKLKLPRRIWDIQLAPKERNLKEISENATIAATEVPSFTNFSRNGSTLDTVRKENCKTQQVMSLQEAHDHGKDHLSMGQKEK